MAIRRVIRDVNLGSYFDIGNIEANKINPIMPAINEVALTTIPTTTGNTLNRNEFVRDNQGENWFVDYAGDGLRLGHNIGGVSFFNTLTTAFPATAQTNTTRVSIPGWSIPVFAGKSYKIEVFSTFTTAAPTTGGSMGFITSAGAAGNIHGSFFAGTSSAVSANSVEAPLYAINTSNVTAGSFMTSTGVNSTTIPHSFKVEALFNCTASGSILIQWGTEVAASLAQLRIGSGVIVTKLN